MSYVCLATRNFDAVVAFYGQSLRASPIRAWDRQTGRGVLLDVHGLRLEILDAAREKRSLDLPPPGDRIHLVIEVPDVDAVYRKLGIVGTGPLTMSWGARCFALRDPDGIPVSFLQWLGDPRGEE